MQAGYEGRDRDGAELAAGVDLKLFYSLVDGHSGVISAAGGHGVKSVRDGDKAGAEGDIIGF